MLMSYKYLQQKQSKRFLKQSMHWQRQIGVYREIIDIRHSHLNQYNFQRYNLSDALCPQDFPDFEKKLIFKENIKDA